MRFHRLSACLQNSRALLKKNLFKFKTSPINYDFNDYDSIKHLQLPKGNSFNFMSHTL